MTSSIDDLDHKLDRRLARLGMQGEAFVPALDIAEDSDNFYLISELPGLDDQDVRVTVDNDVLTISGEKQRERETKKRNLHRVERTFGTFTRSMTLPKTVRADDIRGTFHHGLLEITMPKSPEGRATVREIPLGARAEQKTALAKTAQKQDLVREPH